MTDVNPVESPHPTVPGGHALPSRFSAGPPSPALIRRRRPGLVWGIIGAAAAAVAIGALQLSANLGYDSAEEQYAATAETALAEQAAVRAAGDELRTTADAASLLLESDTAGLIDTASAEALVAAGTTASDALAAADPLITEAVLSPDPKPSWFWELFGAADALTRQSTDAADLTAQLRNESDDITAADTALDASGMDALASAAATAGGLESAHVSARNDSVIALRGAVEDVSATVALDAQAVDAFSSLQVASARLVESENAELAEKAGPLLSARLEVEAFARSIAPGVLLEFDWAPIVNGYGYDGGMGGYTTWWWDEPGRAVIELSDSVAEQWPNARSQALVVHEVGHAISVKCAGMYDASTQDSIEKWATAWAISMGYTDDANGVWAYGYPPQNYIDAAAGCR